MLDSLATGEWWKVKDGGKGAPPPMKVPPDEVAAFALLTTDPGILKMTARLFPLMPDETRRVRRKEIGNRSEASKEELLIKAMSRSRKMRLIAAGGCGGESPSPSSPLTVRQPGKTLSR